MDENIQQQKKQNNRKISGKISDFFLYYLAQQKKIIEVMLRFVESPLIEV